MQHQTDFLELVEEYLPQIKEIQAQELQDKITALENIHIVDVRENSEWQQGHIPNAIHLSKGIIERDIENTIKNKDNTIILYCSGGYRSVLAAYNLQKMGFNNVYSLHGGLRNWLNAGFIIDIK